MISTIKNTQSITIYRYDKTQKKVIEISKPLVVIDYTYYMRAVDRSNQLSTYFQIELKHKWWRTILLKCVDISMSNEFIIYKQFSNGTYNHKEFHLSIIEFLLSAYKLKNSPTVLSINIENYFLRKEQPEKLIRCQECSIYGKRIKFYL